MAPAAPRIVITGTNAAGKSVVLSDTTHPAYFPFGEKAAGFSNLYQTTKVPTSNTTPLGPQTTSALTRPPAAGTVFINVDLPPNNEATPHRISSLEYLVILKGEVVLQLDDGASTTLKAGEFVVNRGTLHSLVNKTGDWARLVVVSQAAEKIALDSGKVLEEYFERAPPK